MFHFADCWFSVNRRGRHVGGWTVWNDSPRKLVKGAVIIWDRVARIPSGPRGSFFALGRTELSPTDFPGALKPVSHPSPVHFLVLLIVDQF